MIAIGVTGTDTGVGKTVVSCAIAASFAQHGGRVGVMKPIETGVTTTDGDRDGLRLAKAALSQDDMKVVTPYTFPHPVAPLVAARRAKTEIDLGRLDGAFRAASKNRDVVIVEGAGGLLVPITPTEAFDSLFVRWKLGVVIVAANRLGVLNHAQLTTRAALASGLRIRAVVLNDVGDAAGDASVSSNEVMLRELLGTVRILRFPWVPPPCDHEALAVAAERSGLIEALTA
ncbi:MAG TPA: dethiobiotin synthase [Gemmatimonadaceae bacterium]|nr:dethiobiotin synthase [Gemmatimonadaceae bacterium]